MYFYRRKGIAVGEQNHFSDSERPMRGCAECMMKRIALFLCKEGSFALAYPLSRQRIAGYAYTHAKKGPPPCGIALRFFFTCTVTALERSRPAADATRGMYGAVVA
jgi:hypothetical protein